ncbi:type III-B CRISPR-associated protein Cas10/Cmr2 [Argonema galeatum]|uniref:type III-B CRISPR-associated protein Cas10/Cmr2 n=1 Tax=Argonema galeatum TaxID=2942762 RepID=UPI002013A133|nr:type III-B CRISPR-associated protein Cas10/Cmr2 [Argonema galeatum]MCL1466526.1 type III-B CRISPR-associated protein Cas10/Cmr2 [Argonema galeatum A003/A1]
MTNNSHNITTAIAWCLAWGDKQEPDFDLTVLQQMRQALIEGKEVPEEVRSLVEEVKQLLDIPLEYCPEKIAQIQTDYLKLWEQKTRIGLVYGGATKIKQYVFEAAKLPYIRGASGLLDQINLIDLPAFFGKVYKPELTKFSIYCGEVRRWLDTYLNLPQDSPTLSEALIPELIIYSTGGNILAFCPAAFVYDLANAIEKRYTERTLTANSCAVGDTFKLLEIHFGLLKNPIEDTFWLERYLQVHEKPLVQAYFGDIQKKPNEPCISDPSSLKEAFQSRKSFNELTTKLAIVFNQRRSGNNFDDRPTRRYPPMFETHPYLSRDEGERRSTVAVVQSPNLPTETDFSEVSARKRRVGDRAKTGLSKTPKWYENTGLEWELGVIEGWIDRFKDFLDKNSNQHQKYCGSYNFDDVYIPQSLTQIGKVSNGFVAYIYADGNNMGGFIQNIRTPQKYKEFSEDVSNATEYAVYQALADNLQPRELRGITEPESTLQDGDTIHPFEILSIGGDDIILIVPADKALEIAKAIGEQFEKILLKEVSLVGVEIKGNYRTEEQKPIDPSKFHRYSSQSQKAPVAHCQLSMSIGVLITAYNTPIYYAKKLFEQLLKSAKKRAKKLKKAGYCGGTVDFLVMKTVTMISSSIEDFRQEALTKQTTQKLKLYAAPYTFHELGGLIKAVKALKEAEFPRSQLYQIRSLLGRGKHTAILNYRYFRVRLKQGKAELKENFEKAWCQAKTNEGNIAPWMYDADPKEPAYETIWRELVDLYDFIDSNEDSNTSDRQLTTQETDL